MADILKFQSFVKKWEGGYSYHPLDNGGPTNMGVTLTTFKYFYGSDKTVNDLKSMTTKQWTSIMRAGFWNPWHADLISNQSIAELCVDFAWASGTVTSIKTVQRLFCLVPDGKVGPKTLAVLNGDNAEQVFNKIKERRLQFINSIVKLNSSQKVFLQGWQNRINDIMFSK